MHAEVMTEAAAVQGEAAAVRSGVRSGIRSEVWIKLSIIMRDLTKS
jgi:hypothetical protein